ANAIAPIRNTLKASIAVVIATLLVSAAAAWASGTWSTTGSMSIGRFSFAAVALQNGKVLVAGGVLADNSTTNTVDLYDPATGTFTPVARMNAPRFGFSATRLQNGKVLVAGGGNDTVGALNTAELYDPTTGTWSVTGTMKEGRQIHSAVLLRDGSVLV